jgi:uncharacterized small protein (DUF1192 family)
MQKAEIKYDTIQNDGYIVSSTLSLVGTLQHLVEVINEMQEEIERLKSIPPTETSPK